MQINAVGSICSKLIQKNLTISITIYYQVKELSKTAGKIIAKQTAYHYVYIVKAKLEIALDEARALANLFGAAINTQKLKLTRENVNGLLKIIQGLNDFDGQDSQFVNAP